MDTAGYASTSLWRRTLAARENDPDKVPRDRLRAAYEGLRRNAIQLVAQISVDLPQITLHDVRHLDGLWKTADLIAGDNFELTPTEAFVFGAAVLLHDAGHALAKNIPTRSSCLIFYFQLSQSFRHSTMYFAQYPKQNFIESVRRRIQY